MSITLFAKGFKEGLNSFGGKISTLLNVCLLSVVYIIAVGGTSLVAKLFGKNFLELKTSKDRKTYWSKLDLNKKPLKEYYRQF